MLAALWIAILAPGAGSAEAALPDGTYTAEYVVLQADNDSVSMANDYWEKPASVTIKDGKATIQMTINHSAWVTEFKVPSGDGYVDTKVISEGDDKRTVEFTADITSPIVSKIHVTVPDIDYDHDYTIRISFDLDSFRAVKAAEPASTQQPAAAAQPAATVEPTATAQPAAKPAAAQPAASPAPGAASSGQKQAAANKPAAAETPETPEAAAAASPTAAVTPPETKQPAEAKAEASASPEEAGAAQPEATGTPAAGGEGAESSAQPLESEAQGEGAALAEADAAEQGEAIAASVAAEEAGQPLSGGSPAATANRWAPVLAAALLIGGGAFYLWKRKRRS